MCAESEYQDVALYGGRRQPSRPEWVREWLKIASLALAHTKMLSSYVEECGILS